MLQSSITPATVATTVREITSIVNQSGTEDQNEVSLEVISQQFKRVADLPLAPEVCVLYSNATLILAV